MLRAVSLLNLPSAQPLQLPAPGAFLNLPAGQAVQLCVLPFSAWWPTLHWQVRSRVVEPAEASCAEAASQGASALASAGGRIGHGAPAISRVAPKAQET